MLLTIIIFVSVLIAINFLLLKFSSNKIAQRKKSARPFIIRERPSVISTQQLSSQLAPTGT
ncbi:MAG: hypothetical protein DRI75_11830 [Bacteroidetes bacterium]|nr:MAG: hypothetical protein DRI75_11830 [Bacteroidota bacterium]